MQSSSSNDSVRQAQAIKDQYEATIRDFERDPARATGMSADEIERRRAAAAAPRQVDIGDKRFNIQSTARAQQILQKGSNEMQLNKRLDEVKKNASFMKSVRWVSIGVSAAAIGMISYMLLLPMVAAHQERAKRQDIRAKRAYFAREQFEREQRLARAAEAEAAAGGKGGSGTA